MPAPDLNQHPELRDYLRTPDPTYAEAHAARLLAPETRAALQALIEQAAPQPSRQFSLQGRYRQLAALAKQLGVSGWPTNEEADEAEQAVVADAHFRELVRLADETKFPANIPYLEQAIACCPESERGEYGRLSYNLGVAYANLARAQPEAGVADHLLTAIAAYHQALTVFGAIDPNFPYRWTSIQYNLGVAYVDLARAQPQAATGYLLTAIAAYNHALTVRSPTDPAARYDWATTQDGLGIAYTDLARAQPEAAADHLLTAIAAFHQALTVRSHTDPVSRYDWADTQLNLGNAFGDLAKTQREAAAGHLLTALAAYNLALTVQSPTDLASRYEWAKTQYNLGVAYVDLAKIQPESAADHLLTAIASYHQALVVRSPTDPASRYDWAKTQYTLGDTHFIRYKLNKHRYEADRPAAIHAFEEALRVDHPTTRPNDCRMTAASLGDVFYADLEGEDHPATRRIYCANARDGAYELAHEAATAYWNAPTTTEAERVALAAASEQHEGRLIHCCLEMQDFEAAAIYALAVKSRSLTQQVAGQRRLLTPAEREALKQAWQPVTARKTQLDALLAEAQRAEKQRRARGEEPAAPDTRAQAEAATRSAAIRELSHQLSPAIARLRHQFPVDSLDAPPLAAPTAAQAQHLAADLGGVTLVEYVRHGAGWGAVVVSPDGVRYVELKEKVARFDRTTYETLPEASLDAVLGESVNALLDETFWHQHYDWETRLTEFYDLLIRPLRESAYGDLLPPPGPGRQLVIAPSRVLHLVPFQALRYLVAQPDGGSQERFLADDYALTFVPSLATLQALHQQRGRPVPTVPATGGLLTLACPGPPDDYLPATLTEVAAIEACFRDHHHPVQSLGDAAPEDWLQTVAAHDYAVLHLACHGSFNFSAPHESALLLAHERRLTVDDLSLWLRLRGRPLVALSACQTNRTQPAPLDEALGLAWAFLAAGAGSVVASQWSVNDDTTAALFGTFYRLRLDEQQQRAADPGFRRRSDAQLLQAAMRELRDRSAFLDSPFFWAAFHVTGLPVPA